MTAMNDDRLAPWAAPGASPRACGATDDGAVGKTLKNTVRGIFQFASARYNPVPGLRESKPLVFDSRRGMRHPAPGWKRRINQRFPGLIRAMTPVFVVAGRGKPGSRRDEALAVGGVERQTTPMRPSWLDR